MTDWEPPKLSELPAKLDGLVAFDLETEDKGLQKQEGPGWAWQDGGKVVGYAFHADNFSGYLPIAHEGGGNLDPEKVREIVRKWLGNPNQVKVGANVLYDLGWAKRDGIEVKGPVYDVQWAEALLNEHRTLYTPDMAKGGWFEAYPWEEEEQHLSFSLNSLAKSYFGRGKNEQLLKEAAIQFKLDPKNDMWRLPSKYVGPYASTDAELTNKIMKKQDSLLADKNLWDLLKLECALLPLYLDMRWRGVRIDLDRTQELRNKWTGEVATMLSEIKNKTGIEVNLNASESLAKALKTQNINCPVTEKTNKDSITTTWLKSLKHWLPDLIAQAKAKNKLVGTFIDGAILGSIKNNRVHTQFHPLRGEYGGTISGRLSSSDPNLQQAPKRSEDGLMLRSCFIPEEGEEWFSIDYSQQEPRITVHYAAITTRNGAPLPKALEAMEKYQKDPKMSYHKMVAEETGLPYDIAKIMNLALAYGRGKKSTADAMGVSLEEAKAYIEKYHERTPFIKALDEVLNDVIMNKGEIRTLLGRVCRFPMWELNKWNEKEKQYEKSAAVPLWKAQQLWSSKGQRIRRAWLHKKLNRLIQGSAADQTKKAMLDIWNAGLGGNMLVQVHDELCFSFNDRKKAEEAAKLMENAVPLKVPVIAEIKQGKSWGTVK